MLQEGLKGFGILLCYYLVCATALLALGKTIRFPGEVFRKMLHIVCTLSIFPLLYGFQTWYLAVGAVLTFAAVVYLGVWLLERFPAIFSLLRERSPGEIRASLMIVFGMMALLMAVFWGWLGEEWKFIIIAAVMAWGFGDAAAALVGKAIGRRKIRLRCVEGTKTWAGTLAMYAVSGVAIFATLAVRAPIPFGYSLGVALLSAAVAAFVEMVSHHGIDTLTVPVATSAVVFGLVKVAMML